MNLSGPLLLSLSTAGTASILAFLPALGAAWVMERSKGWVRAFARALVLLPVVLPPVATGFLLLKVLGPHAPAGSVLAAVGLRAAFGWPGAVVACAAGGFPFLAWGMASGIRAADPSLADLARTLGETRWGAFCRVTMPLALPGISYGLLLCFARGLGEFGTTIVLAGHIPGETDTLPLAFYEALHVPGGDGRAWALCAISAALALVSVAVLGWLDRQGEAR